MCCSFQVLVHLGKVKGKHRSLNQRNLPSSKVLTVEGYVVPVEQEMLVAQFCFQIAPVL